MDSNDSNAQDGYAESCSGKLLNDLVLWLLVILGLQECPISGKNQMKLIYKLETLGHVREIFGWKKFRYIAQVYLTLLDCLVQKQSDTRDGVTCCSPLKTHG